MLDNAFKIITSHLRKISGHGGILTRLNYSTIDTTHFPQTPAGDNPGTILNMKKSWISQNAIDYRDI